MWSVAVVLWILFGYFACGIGWYLLLVYLGVKGVIDPYSIFYVDNGIDGLCNAIFWPISLLGLSCEIFVKKANEWHKNIKYKMEWQNGRRQKTNKH